LPNVGPYIYDVSISGFTRSSIYIYDISSLRVKGQRLTYMLTIQNHLKLTNSTWKNTQSYSMNFPYYLRRNLS